MVILRSLSLLVGLVLLLAAPAALAKSQAQPGRGKGRARAGRQAARGGPAREVATYDKAGLPNILAQAAVVVDLTSGEELYARRPDDVRPIASISKLMAMMVVLDRGLDLDGVTEMLPTDRDLARRGARSRLPTGMKFTNRDLLHAALMASDNRAVPALGRAVGLDPERLTEAMNDKAGALGLRRTSFGDPTGLDDRNRSTPRELARVLRAAAAVPLIGEISKKAKYLARAVDRPGYTVEYENTDLVARGGRFTVLTGKTGYTDLAGYCLAIAAHLPPDGGNRDVAMVFLGEAGKLTRFGDFGRVAQWIAEKRPGLPAPPPAGATASELPPPPPAPGPATDKSL